MQAKTITGKISNLGDAMDGMFNSIGQANEGVINDSIDGLKYLVENYEQVGRVLLGLVATYGTYRAALILTNAYGIYDVATKNLQFAATMKNIVATNAMIVKQALLNSTMLANPFVLVTTLVIGTAAAMWALHDSTSAAEKAQKRFNEDKEEAIKKEKDHKQKLEELISTIQSEYTSSMDRVKAMDVIKENYPSLFQKYIDEKGHIKDLIGLWKEYNKEASIGKVQDNKKNLSASKNSMNEYQQMINLWNRFGEDPNFHKNDLSDKEKLLAKKYNNETLNTLKSKLEEENNLRLSYQKEVRSDEIAQWQLDLKKKTDIQIKVELDEMKRIQQARKNNPRYSLNVGIGSLKGATTDKELQQRVGILESEYNVKQQGESSYKKDYDKAKTAWEDAKKELSEIEKDKSKFTSKQYEEAKKLKESTEKSYKDLGGITGSAQSKQESAADKLREQQEKLALLMDKQGREQIRSTEDLWNEVWQAQIDSMDEGSEKTLTQIELNHKKELQILDRQKEDKLREAIESARAIFDAKENEAMAKNPNHVKQTFDGSGITLDETTNTQFDDKYKAALDKQAKERQAYFDAEKQAMNEYLAAYGDYDKKRKAIIAQGEEKKKGKNVWEQKSVDEETKKALSDIDIEVNKKTSAIGKLFDDMKDRTVKDMRSIADSAEQMLSFINSGTWDESQGIQFGISKETFDTLKKSPQELESIKNEIANVRKEADASETAFNKIGNGLKKVFSAGDDAKKLKEGLEEISQGMNDVMQAGQFLSDSLSQLGDALGSGVLSGIAEGLNVAMDAMSSTMDGAKAGAMFGPIGAVAGAAIGLVSSLASSIAKIHDAKNEKRITVLQDQIEVLERSYDKLGNSIEKAYSKDASKLISQQNTLLEQQKFLIRNQIAEEKDKKKSDDGRIKEWEQQIEDINKLIEDNKEKQVDAIFGEDTKSAIDNFAQAYADAWASNEDRTKSAKDVVKDMMRQMVTESIKAAIQSSQSMEKIRAKLQEFYSDNVLSGWEQDYIYNMAESLQKELDDKFGWADSLMKGEEESTSQDSTKGMSQSMDQDTGNELNGRFTAFQESNEGIKISNEEIKNSMLSMLVSMSLISVSVNGNGVVLTEIRNLMISSNGYLEDIAKYTKSMLEFGAKLDKIESNTKGLTSR